MMAKDLFITVLIAIAASGHDSDSRGVSLTSAFSPTTAFRRCNVIPPLTSRGPLYSPDAHAPVFNHRQTLISRQITRVVVATSSPSQPQQGDKSKDVSTPRSKSHSLRRTIYLHVWVILMTAFIITNSKIRPYPQFLLYALSQPQWALVHAICSMLFSGTIILSTLIEYLVIASRKASVIKFWFLSIPQRLDAKVVLPALTGAVVSGVGQASTDYGGLAKSPKHIVGAFHLLLMFGLWWGITDITSQRRAVEVVQEMNNNSSGDDDDAMEIPTVLKLRVISNIVSCLLVVGLYALMVLKPGFGK